MAAAPAKRGARAKSLIALQRRIQRQIAPAYDFLASPQCSSYITGEIVPVTGGYGGG